MRGKAGRPATRRSTTRLTAQVSAGARELAGRPSARLLPALGIAASRHVMLRVLLPALAVPRADREMMCPECARITTVAMSTLSLSDPKSMQGSRGSSLSSKSPA
jgi:hypothetical protein